MAHAVYPFSTCSRSAVLETFHAMSNARRIVRRVVCAVLVLACAFAPLAYALDPLADRAATVRVKRDEVDFLARMGQIDRAERQRRLTALAAEDRAIQIEYRRRPRNQQAEISQEAERLYYIRIAPLRADWDRKLEQRRNALAARDRAIEVELTGDIDQAARIQIAQNVARERL